MQVKSLKLQNVRLETEEDEAVEVTGLLLLDDPWELNVGDRLTLGFGGEDFVVEKVKLGGTADLGTAVLGLG